MARYVWYNTTGDKPRVSAELVIEDGKPTWVVENKNIRHELEEIVHPLLVMKKLSIDGKFDYANPDHTGLLPLMYRSPYLYCQREKDNG